MTVSEEIKQALNSIDEIYFNGFPSFGNGYDHFICSRISLFKKEKLWGIVIEHTSYNNKQNQIRIDITTYSNYLKELEICQEKVRNNIFVILTDYKNKTGPFAWDGFSPNFLGKDSPSAIMIRGKTLQVPKSKKEYDAAGVVLLEYQEGEASAADLGRFFFMKLPELFRATDNETVSLFKKPFPKILVIDNWFHVDYIDHESIFVSETYPFLYDQYKDWLKKNKVSKKEFVKMRYKKDFQNIESLEIWQQIAKVLETGDIKLYNPTMPPNNHWKYWPEGGSL